MTLFSCVQNNFRTQLLFCTISFCFWRKFFSHVQYHIYLTKLIQNTLDIFLLNKSGHHIFQILPLIRRPWTIWRVVKHPKPLTCSLRLNKKLEKLSVKIFYFQVYYSRVFYKTIRYYNYLQSILKQKLFT